MADSALARASEGLLPAPPAHGAPPAVAASLRGVRKSFYGVTANDDVTLDLHRGEVHALLGENGAGKSTLCSILAGLYRPDAGELVVGGQPQQFGSPRDALAAGVGMVYQHFRLVETLTVAENLVLGHPDCPRWLSAGRLQQLGRELCQKFGLDVDPAAHVWELSVGEQQRVEILKLLHRGVDILILDEPTAVLTTQERDSLFRAVDALREAGKTIVFVSHKLAEVMEVSDRISVLRGGRLVGQVEAPAATAGELARLMVGRQFTVGEGPADAPPPGDVVLEVTDLQAPGDRVALAVDGMSVALRQGEILGVLGVAGNGQRELAEAIAGLRPIVSGRVELDGHDVTTAGVRERSDRGLAFVPEDRLEMGVAAGLPLEDNLALRSYRSARFSRGPMLSTRAMRRWAGELTEAFSVQGARAGLPVSLLSGGNLQRAILARELSGEPKVIVAASPTRGLDVAAIDSVRECIRQQRDRGAGVLLVSEDLDELQALSDRVVVVYEGAIVGEVTADEFDPEQLGLMMSGHARQGAGTS